MMARALSVYIIYHVVSDKVKMAPIHRNTIDLEHSIDFFSYRSTGGLNTCAKGREREIDRKRRQLGGGETLSSQKGPLKFKTIYITIHHSIDLNGTICLEDGIDVVGGDPRQIDQVRKFAHFHKVDALCLDCPVRRVRRVRRNHERAPNIGNLLLLFHTDE